VFRCLAFSALPWDFDDLETIDFLTWSWWPEHCSRAPRRQFGELISALEEVGKPLLIGINLVRSSDLLDENGGDPQANISRLRGLLEGNDLEREQLDSTRKAARAADTAALAKLLTGSVPTMIERSDVIEVLGQQVNFEAQTIFRAEQLVFEEL